MALVLRGGCLLCSSVVAGIYEMWGHNQRSSFVLGCRFKDVRRNLQKDIDELKSYGIQDVFVLCTKGELLKYRVPNLIDAYQECGICVHHYPIPDGDAPDITTCCTILEELRSCLESNRKTIIHCYGGLGRSCLIAACLLLQLSDVVTPQQAIDSLRDLRGSRAIQTIKQYNFIHDFRENVAAHLATQDTVQRSVSRWTRAAQGLHKAAHPNLNTAHGSCLSDAAARFQMCV